VLALAALPWGAFGEREHVTLILVLPYVLLFALRDEGTRVPTGLALWGGMFAGFGFAIKPHFAIPWALLGAVALVRRRGPALFRRPEFLASSVVALLCVLAVLRFEAGYTSYMLRFGGLYLHYVRQHPLLVALIGEEYGALVVVLAVVTTGVLWRRVPARAQSTVLFLLVATLGFYAVAVLQLKGWRYHYLPGVGCASVLLVALLSVVRLPLARPVERLYRMAALAALAVLVGSGVMENAARLGGRIRATYDPDYESLRAVVRQAGGGRPLAVLSANLASAFPLASESGVGWALRYGGLPWLPALYPEEVGTGRLVQHRRYAARSPLERSFAEDVLADLRGAAPGLIVVALPITGGSYYRQFDYLGYFGEVPGFNQLLEAYRPLGQVGAYLVFQRGELARMRGTSDPLPAVSPKPPGFPEAGKRLALAVLALGVVLLEAARGRRAPPSPDA
jgi:hypothetical protein